MTTLNDTYTATLDILDLLPWWAHGLSGLFAVLGVLLRFRWVLALVPVAGPVLLLIANAAVGLLKLLSEYVLRPYLKNLGTGICRACTSIPGITVALTGAMAFILVGIVVGVKLTGHLVREATGERDQARIERDTAQAELTQWEGRLDEEKSEAAAARAARDEALARVKAEADARKRAVAAHARTERLRNDSSTGAPAAKAGPKDAPPAGLLGFPALSWPGQ